MTPQLQPEVHRPDANVSGIWPMTTSLPMLTPLRAGPYRNSYLSLERLIPLERELLEVRDIYLFLSILSFAVCYHAQPRPGAGL
jgi:hypothetical protein